MGKIVPAPPVTPILGVIFRDPAVVDECMLWIERLLGDVDLVSPDFPFDLTDHYEPEMGPNLVRRFYSFECVTDPEMLADWKVQTNRLEEEAAVRFGEYRPLNLDPGYVNGAKLVLASVKGLAHRVYIGSGIHAEVTMSYRAGAWLKRDYTFPDFAAGRYDGFFSKVRARHLELSGTRAVV